MYELCAKVRMILALAQDHLNLPILRMLEGTFSLDAAQINLQVFAPLWAKYLSKEHKFETLISVIYSIVAAVSPNYTWYPKKILTLAVLNKLKYLFSANQITWSSLLIQIHLLNEKQCWSRSEANWSGSTLFAKTGYIRVQQDQG